jgi:hypothetical protein
MRGIRCIALVCATAILTGPTAARAAVRRGQGRASIHRATVTARGMGDAATDSVYRFDGSGLTRTDLPRGTLASAGGTTVPCPQNVACSRLHYRWTKCFQIDDGYSYAYQCFHVYAADSSSKTLGYRVGWWTGTANADRGSDLVEVVDRDDQSGCAACGVRVDEWAPSGDTYPPQSGRTINLGFGLSGAGVNASIGESLTVFSQVYGPQAGYPRPTRFHFLWAGDVGPGTSIGMGGGDEWQFRRATGFPWQLSITNTVCYPSWLC